MGEGLAEALQTAPLLALGLAFLFNIITQLFDPVVLSPDGTTMMSGFFNFDLDWEWFWTAPE